MLKCNEVPVEVSLALDDDLPLRRRIGLRFHVLMCRHCRRYLRQARRLAKAWRRHGDEASEEEVETVLKACRHHPENGEQPEH